MKKAELLLMGFLFAFLLIPTAALAADGTISANGSYDIGVYGNDSTITINSGLTVTLTNTSASTYTNMKIVCGSGVEMTLNGVSIDNSSNPGCALSFTGAGNSLILAGTNILWSAPLNDTASIYAGIHVSAAESTVLNISGSGYLEAHGGYLGAGIGGNGPGSGETYGETGGTIAIDSGTIKAYGGLYGSGIGAGYYAYSGGSVTINGGTVYAYGGQYGGAGIGGAAHNGSTAGLITINGGTIYAYGGVSGASAGIGGGHGGNGGTILITGGTINAIGGSSAAGIGGGGSGNGGSITISGGTVTASSPSYGAAIGGGSYSSCGNIDISGGTVVATGSWTNPGIGCGNSGNGGSITISGTADVTATGGYYAAGIGGASQTNVDKITISGGTVKAVGGNADSYYGGSGGAGIGGGGSSPGLSGGDSGDVTLSGGIVFAQKGSNAPLDIGYGGEFLGSSTGTIEISGTVAVFLRNNLCIPDLLPDGHVNKTPTDLTDPMIFSGNEVYGITVPPTWTTAQGGYFRLYTVAYDANGGSGTPPNAPPVQHIGTTLTVADGSGLTKPGYTNKGWNTQSNGSGSTYISGSLLTLTANMTLYALWKAPIIPQTGDFSPPVYLFAGLALLCLLGLVAGILSRRKRSFQ